ncbi:hypothetical protein BHM03_00021285 [Ensete ventricosum]|uniref:Nucleotide-diphospho-sugar transferase domain-containing protein n=1 Tax=Ensete ventricosum TaxID=4639 RepID=A0A426ZR34_ENSVE|nr:hypothetical protein B296_00002604 [Ensete ventricosum]RZR73190.1 hypothetical protein BHM03_00021285 [Ensete ventricosum]
MRPPSPRSAIPGRCLSSLLLIAAVILPCAVLYRAAAPTSPPSWRPGPAIPDTSPIATQLESEDVRLEKVLEEAAMENKTVILTTLNAAWATPGSIIDLFIESFQIGVGTRKLLDHLVIIALDKAAYVRCLSIHAHCFPLITEGADFSDEKLFMSAGYLSMMWTRIEFLRLVLEKGYNFIFSDVDILWFRNPLPQFYPEVDFQIACDHFMGDAFDLQNIPNGGFNYVNLAPLGS